MSSDEARVTGDRGFNLRNSIFFNCACLLINLCRWGIVETLYLLELALHTSYFSEALVVMSCCFLYRGKRCLKFSTFKLFTANLKQSLSLLSNKVSILRYFSV